MKNKKCTIYYILIALFAYMGANLLPSLFQTILYFFADKIGIGYDYFNHNMNMCYVLISLLEIIVFGLVFRWLTKKRDAKKTGLKKTETIGVVTAAAFGISGISLVWILMIDKLSAHIPLLQKWVHSFNQSMSSLNEGSYFWLVLAVCIVGPILEELIFRGVIFNALKKVFKNPIPIILICGIAFGVWHGNFVQSVYTSIMGIVLALVYEKTNDMKYPILIHMLNNMISTLPPQIENTVLPQVMDIGCILMIVPAGILIYHILFRSRSAYSI